MEMGSYQMLHDGRNEGLATIGRVIFATGGQPILKMDCAKPRMFRRGVSEPVVQTLLRNSGRGISATTLRESLVAARYFPAEFVEAQSFRAGEFDHWPLMGSESVTSARGGCDVVRGHWLKQGGRTAGQSVYPTRVSNDGRLRTRKN